MVSIAFCARRGRRAAIWAAGLYPVYTLAMTGMSAVNMILLLPFVIYSFAAVQSAIDPQAALRRRIMMAGLSGLLIGMAGMLKQTAIFEAVAVFAVICLYGERRKLMELGAAFAAGAALPVLAFSAYFFAKGHFHDLLECVIVLAMQRTAPDVLASYGADKAGEFSFFGTLKNTFLPSVPLIFLWGGVIFAAIRRRRIVQVFPVRLLVIAAIWLGFSLIGVMFGRGLVDYYLLGLVPPMLILSAALFAHGVGNPDRPIRVLIFSALVGSATMIWADQDHFLAKETIPTGDYLGEEKVSDRLIALGLKPKNDRLLVVNRGYGIYIRTGALPASPYFYGTHLLGVFHTPSADPLGVALDARPEFIVVANPGLYRIVEQQANWARVRAFLKAHYSAEEPIQGQKDIFFIYKYRGE